MVRAERARELPDLRRALGAQAECQRLALLSRVRRATTARRRGDRSDAIRRTRLSRTIVKLSLALIACAVLGIVAPSAAVAQTPSAYRAQLNGHCRTFTPKFKQVEANLRRAVSTKDPKLLASALGQGLVLNLRQDAYIEKVPVPAALRTQMVLTLRLLRTVDKDA